MYTLFPSFCPAGLSDLQTDGKESLTAETPSSPASSSPSSSSSWPAQVARGLKHSAPTSAAAQRGRVRGPGPRDGPHFVHIFKNDFNGNEVSRKKQSFQSVSLKEVTPLKRFTSPSRH